MDRNHQGVNRGSSQIWGPYLAMRQQERDMSGLFYRVKNVRVSPYLELQADSLYENGSYGDGFAHLDANPYLRFFSIFDPLLSPDDSGYDEFDTALADILLHYLADLDLKMGMSSYDFYRSFLVREMEAGVFGALDELSAFSYMEKQEIASQLLRFYHTGDGPGTLQNAVEALLPECRIYIREGWEFVCYMRQPYDGTEKQRLDYLIRLFLPLSCACTVHWMQTYGVTGYDGTMRTGDFILA